MLFKHHPFEQLELVSCDETRRPAFAEHVSQVRIVGRCGIALIHLEHRQDINFTDGLKYSYLTN